MVIGRGTKITVYNYLWQIYEDGHFICIFIKKQQSRIKVTAVFQAWTPLGLLLAGHYFDLRLLWQGICGQCIRGMQRYLKYNFKYCRMLIER